VRLPEVTLGIVEDVGLVRTICEWSISANRLGAARSKALNKEKGRELDALALILMWHVEDYFGCRGRCLLLRRVLRAAAGTAAARAAAAATSAAARASAAAGAAAAHAGAARTAAAHAGVAAAAGGVFLLVMLLCLLGTRLISRALVSGRCAGTLPGRRRAGLRAGARSLAACRACRLAGAGVLALGHDERASQQHYC
jgi:hypothetical protein